MALKSTIYKINLQISDMDRHYYQEHLLTLAKHPSETDERLMVRILAFSLNANENLQFTKGLSTDAEPDIWQLNYSDEIEHWIELGQLDEKRIKKACHKAKRVSLFSYQSGSANVWWNQIKDKLNRFENLHIYHLENDISKQLAQLCTRNMNLQCTIQDSDIWLSNTETSVEVKCTRWKY